jgi:hypothetical protein
MLREMAVRNREELFSLKKRGHVRRHRCTIGYSKEGQEKMARLIIRWEMRKLETEVVNGDV